MRSTRLIAVLVGLAAIATVAADAHAYYHPTMGRFVSRDPGAGAGGAARAKGAGPAVGGRFIPRAPTRGNEYADGMSLYLYAGGNPVVRLDPMGLKYEHTRSEHAVEMGKLVVDFSTYKNGCKGWIEFIPDKDECPKCKLIRLVQIVRYFDTPEHDSTWYGAEANRNKLKTKEDKEKNILPYFFVDHFARKCKEGEKCSFYYRDHVPKASHDGSNNGEKPVSASLWDSPHAWAGAVMEFESCARCDDNGEYYGCVTWGWSSDANGDVTLKKPAATNSPSATFNEAIRIFNDFYSEKEKEN